MPSPSALARTRFTLTRQHLQFAYICLIWGGTWLAMKVGIEAVPPAIFSGIRWTFAGLAVLGVEAMRGRGARVPAGYFGGAGVPAPGGAMAERSLPFTSSFCPS